MHSGIQTREGLPAERLQRKAIVSKTDLEYSKRLNTTAHLRLRNTTFTLCVCTLKTLTSRMDKVVVAIQQQIYCRLCYSIDSQRHCCQLVWEKKARILQKR